MAIGLSKLRPIRQGEILILILCLVIGFALRFYTFDQKSLWVDEVYTLNDSRDGLTGQIQFYRENPTYLHPPLFFVLTHLFYPFTNPERDLRIIPLIFGTLSIPMLYVLSRSFSHRVALLCTLSLTFMAYHINLSQDGRSYSLVMFLGMAAIYFLMKHLETSRRGYLLLVALSFAALFYTNYNSVLFIVLSQILWFYQPSKDDKKYRLYSFLILNGLTLILCVPWALFILANYKGGPMLEPILSQQTGSLWDIMSGIFVDWVPSTPLAIASAVLLVLFPFLSKDRRNALSLLAVFVLPVLGLYLFCNIFQFRHFVSSRYFINFLPLFFVSIYVSLNAVEIKLIRLSGRLRLSLFFLILFMVSNVIIFPFYYRSEKQDFRGLVSYLEGEIRDGDKIFVGSPAYIPGILHYFGAYPESRHYRFPGESNGPGEEIALRVSLGDQNKEFTIHYSPSCCAQYVADGNRLWIIVGVPTAKELRENSPSVLKGVFDGRVSNFRRFLSDASMYLFLWDPLSPEEIG